MNRYPFFLFLFAVYPSLALLASNFREVDASAIIRPLLFSILVGAIIFVISFWLIPSLPKATLISTIFITFFFSWGHISSFVEGSTLAATLGERSWLIDIFLTFAMVLILFFLARTILKTKKDLSPVYQILNFTALFLVLSSAFLLINSFSVS